MRRMHVLKSLMALLRRFIKEVLALKNGTSYSDAFMQIRESGRLSDCVDLSERIGALARAAANSWLAGNLSANRLTSNRSEFWRILNRLSLVLALGPLATMIL